MRRDRRHATYLGHDLFITDMLDEYITTKLTLGQQEYSRRVLSPLLAILARMSETGVEAHLSFIKEESQRLQNLLNRIAEAHLIRHRIDLSDLGERELRELLYKTYRLPVLKGPKWKGSIDAGTLESLIQYTDQGPLKDSLKLIAGYRNVEDLRDRLASYGKYIDPNTGRIHSQFSTKQSSGRVSSQGPNLQQLARAKKIMPGTEFATVIKTRNAIVAPTGCVLIGADINQADVRSLGQDIASCEVDTATHKTRLLERREAVLGPVIGPYCIQHQCLNPAFKGQSAMPPPSFEPGQPSQLVQDFRSESGDFYSLVASNITGRTIGKGDHDRSVFKTVLLKTINGSTAVGLRKELRCSRTEAERFMTRLFEAYLDVATILALLRSVSLTGQTTTWQAGLVLCLHTAGWSLSRGSVFF